MAEAAAPAQGCRPWCRGQWLAWAAAPWVVLCGLWLALPLSWPAQVDSFIAVNHRAAACPPALWSQLTLLGDTAVLLTLLSPLLVWRPQAVMAALASVPVGGLLSVIAKWAFQTPRPGAVLEAGQFNLIGPLLSHHSFPSGHSITAFAVASAVLATTVPLVRGWRSGLLLGGALLLASAVGCSRLAVGAHWPLDVLAGASGGWLAGLVGALATRRWQGWWQSPTQQGRVATTLALVGLWLLCRRLDYPLGQPVQWVAAACAWGTAIVLLMRWWAGRPGLAPRRVAQGPG